MGCMYRPVRGRQIDSRLSHSDRRAARVSENKSAPTLMRSERESRWKKSLLHASARSLSQLAETTHTHATTHGCDSGAGHGLERNDKWPTVNGRSYEICAWAPCHPDASPASGGPAFVSRRFVRNDGK